MRVAAVIGFLLLAAACAQRKAPEPLAVQTVRRAETQLGYEPTRNFHREGGRHAYFLCYATGPLELPADYGGLRSKLSREPGCRFDSAKLDVFVYPAEAMAGREAPVTDALASAQPARRDFVVAHEDFHEQQGVRQLEPALKEAVSMLAGLLTAAEAASLRDDREERDRTIAEADLFLQKAQRINAAHRELRALYDAYARGEVSQSEALARKQEAFARLQAECDQQGAPRPRAFHPCPAVMNNAGLAFDATYTREYPRVHALFEANGRDPKRTIEALRRLAETPGAAERFDAQ
ncbi:MAG: aminopeptidase [Acidobacteria bacterium]|nr:aminopeptidase [Acidobacteriota bacterium]